MKDYATAYRDSNGSVIQRFLAHIRNRKTSRERHDGRLRFGVRLGGDGYDYISPLPSGAALPMRRLRSK